MCDFVFVGFHEGDMGGFEIKCSAKRGKGNAGLKEESDANNAVVDDVGQGEGVEGKEENNSKGNSGEYFEDSVTKGV